MLSFPDLSFPASQHAVRAKETEAFLVGKPLNNETLQGAVRVLQKELIPRGLRPSD